MFKYPKFLGKKATLFLALILTFLICFPSLSEAHAFIVKSTPSENQVFTQAPKTVSIQFDESVQPTFLTLEVFDSNGNRVDRKNGHIDTKDSTTIECSLNKNLDSGTYSIKWKVISSDGHPVQGVIPFQIGNNVQKQAGADQDSVTKGYMPQADLVVIRWLQYLSNACIAGILFFHLVILPKDLVHNTKVNKKLSPVLLYSSIILAWCILLNLPLQATIESGLPWSKVFHANVFGEMLRETNFGNNWILQIVLMVVLMVVIYLVRQQVFKKRVWQWITFVIGLGLLLTKVFTSHAASSTHPFIPVVFDFIHLLTASIWIGCLAAMAVLSPLVRSEELKIPYLNTVRRFSIWGISLVLLLTLTGVYNSLQFIPNFHSLVSTNYGRVLLGKVILLILMVLLAAFNWIHGRKKSTKGLVLSIKSELITGAIILILSVILTNLPTAMSSPGPFSQTAAVENGNKITFKATPNVIGENTFEVTLVDQNGKSLKNIQQVEVTFTSLEMGMGDDTVNLKKLRNGKYVYDGMNFNMAGNWKVHVHALTVDLDSLDKDFYCFVGSE